MYRVHKHLVHLWTFPIHHLEILMFVKIWNGFKMDTILNQVITWATCESIHIHILSLSLFTVLLPPFGNGVSLPFDMGHSANVYEETTLHQLPHLCEHHLSVHTSLILDVMYNLYVESILLFVFVILLFVLSMTLCQSSLLTKCSQCHLVINLSVEKWV